MTLAWLAGLAVVTGAACSSSSAPAGHTTVAPTPLPALGAMATTASQRVVAAHAKASGAGPNPAIPANLASYIDQGYGDLASSAGEALAPVTIDGTAPPALGPGAKRLVRFAHLADLQLVDDESPARLAQFDTAGETSAAARTQDAEMCRLANAAVRSINALHAADPMAFTLLGGDNVDNAQSNELDWVLGILGGAPQVECDSGSDDDPVPGPDNDGKDPFVADGLKMPFKWVSGNHDVLVQGNFAVDDTRIATSIGGNAVGGTRDYAQGGAIVQGDVIADPRRRAMRRADLMAKVAAHGDGHGIGDAQKQSGKAFYTFDVEGTPLRFVILDLNAETGGGNGLLHQADLDSFVKPALDAAQRDGKWVILASHQAADNMTTDGGAFGTAQPDALTAEAYKAFIGGYGNVLFSVLGHYHVHQVQPIAPAGGHAWWEIVSASIADYPHQYRVIEIWDGDNGWVLLRATCVDVAVEGDPVAERGRELGVVDYTSGWNPAHGEGTEAGRNVELWIRKPAPAP